MSWVKLDDGFTDAPKIEALSDGAFRVHIRALCLCARVLSDGFVARSVAVRWGQKRVSECLVGGVWHAGDDLCKHCVELLVTKGGYDVAPVRPDAIYLHDFLDYNRSRVEVLRERDASRTRQQRWAERVQNARTDGVDDGVPHGVSAPAPTRPGVPSEHLRARTREREEAKGVHPPKYAGRCPECNASLVVDDQGRRSGHADGCSRTGLLS